MPAMARCHVVWKSFEDLSKAASVWLSVASKIVIGFAGYTLKNTLDSSPENEHLTKQSFWNPGHVLEMA